MMQPISNAVVKLSAYAAVAGVTVDEYRGTGIFLKLIWALFSEPA